MKTRAAVKTAVPSPIRPLIHPNSFPGMVALRDLIGEYEERFQKGVPTEQAMFDQLWQSFNDLWSSVDNYMGNPTLPSLKEFRKNIAYLKSVASDCELQATLDLEAEGESGFSRGQSNVA